MEKLKERFCSLKYLKWLFLGSLIISALAFLMMLITSALQAAGLLDNNPNAQALVVFDQILFALRIVIYLGAAVIAFLACKISKANKIAVYLLGVSLALFVVSVILEFTTSVPYVTQTFALLASLLYVLGIYYVYQGILFSDRNLERKLPFHQIIIFALALLFIHQILMFIASLWKFNGGFNVGLAYVALTVSLIANILLFFCSNQIIKLSKDVFPELKEEKE